MKTNERMLARARKEGRVWLVAAACALLWLGVQAWLG
jgi:hypothetical protein